MSYILTSILRKKDADWNRIVYDEDATDRLLQRLRLPVVTDEAAKVKGEYIVDDDGFSMIVLKPNLKNPLKLWVVLHEIGHHLLHYPVNHRFSKGTRRRMDREANFFAALALLPTWLVRSKTLEEIIEEYGYPLNLIKIRKEIYDIDKV